MLTEECTASARTMTTVMTTLLLYPSVTQLSQWRVFFKVAELDHGRGVRQADLNHSVGSSNATVSRALDVLDHRVAKIGNTTYPAIDLVRREENFGGVGNMVYITETGKGLLRILATVKGE